MNGETIPPCQTNPEAWWSTNATTMLGAILACLTCPLREPCQALGEHEPEGIWGGIAKHRPAGRPSVATSAPLP